MAAYVIGDIEVTDPAVYDDYRKQVLATVTKYGGKVIVRGGKGEPLEGGWTPKRLGALEVPSMAQALLWYPEAVQAPLVQLSQESPRRRPLVDDRGQEN